MKVAILSDIHGNSVALDAVLQDIDNRGGADAFWVLGDVVAFGHDPVGVLERLHTLPGLKCIRGNTDRYVITGERPPPTFEEAAASPTLLSVLTEVAGSLAWTLGALTATNWLTWLAALPTQFTHPLPNEQSALVVHAAPGLDDGPGMPPQMSDDDIQKALRQTDATLICVGHTHYVVDRHIGQWHIVNPGSIGLARPDDLRASYAILAITQTGYHITHQRVGFDRQAVIETLQEMRHPGAGYIIRNLSARQ